MSPALWEGRGLSRGEGLSWFGCGFGQRDPPRAWEPDPPRGGWNETGLAGLV